MRSPDAFRIIPHQDDNGRPAGVILQQVEVVVGDDGDTWQEWEQVEWFETEADAVEYLNEVTS